MAANTVEQIFVELLLNATGYNKSADDAIKRSNSLDSSLQSIESQAKRTGGALSDMAKLSEMRITEQERSAKRSFDLEKASIDKSFKLGEIGQSKRERLDRENNSRLFDIQRKSLVERIELAKKMGDDTAVFDNQEKLKDLVNNQKIMDLQSKAATKSALSLANGIRTVLKGVVGLAAAIAAGTGLLRLADEARKANDELNFLSKNLGMTSRDVRAWQGAAAALGGSAQGITNDMKSLNSAMNDFKTTGDTSLLPVFNALGVGMVDAQGKLRDTDEVLLDLSESMSRMDREQAVLLGQKLGFDEGTINALLQGRDAMQDMVNYHRQMYQSSKEELEASRQLSESQAKLAAHWESMKLMMGNAIIPLLNKLAGIALRFFEFLQKHQKTVKDLFQGFALFLGVLVIPLLGKALIALTAFIAPFAPFILVVGALAAAFASLYEDYAVWARGGDSLFNWGAFTAYIDGATFSVDNLKNGFAKLLTGYDNWSQAAEDGKSWLKLKGFIDDSGVSVNSLVQGFSNLSRELMDSTIPHLRAYAEVFSKLKSGDFSGAASQAKELFDEFVRRDKEMAQRVKDNVQQRAKDALDLFTGQEVGTFDEKVENIFEDEAKQERRQKLAKDYMQSRKPYDKIVSDEKSTPQQKKEAQKIILELSKKYQEDDKRLVGQQKQPTKALQISERDIIDIMKVASTEVAGSLKGEDFEKQAAGVIDTILNRAASGKFGGGVREVVNQKWAFSDINAPRKSAYGSVQNVPMSRVDKRMEDFVRQYIAERAKGRESIVGRNVNYANPTQMQEASASTKKWVAEVEKQAKQTGQVFGKGKAIHVHGTPEAERHRMPQPYRIVVDAPRQQVNAVSQGAAQAQQTMPQVQAPTASTTNANKTTNVDVNINEVKVQSTASTITGTVTDAMAAAQSSFMQLIKGMN